MIKLMQGDCLDLMGEIEPGSVDLVLTDPPYGTTACKWDSVIPFDPMWENLKRVIRSNGAIVLFGAEPFSSLLRSSNLGMFKYDWIWVKSRKVGFVNAKLKPMNAHEIVSVFSFGKTSNGSKNNMVYNPQGLEPLNKFVRGRGGKSSDSDGNGYGRPSMKPVLFQEYTNYPCTVIEFNSEPKPVHPTQKPVALLEYLIKTYTNEGGTVLDFTMGSGSTGVAAKNLGRKFIGIEKDPTYFEIATQRVGV